MKQKLTSSISYIGQLNLGGTALIRAVAGRHIELVKLLLANGADVTIKTLYGDTALTIAQENGHLEIIELLEKAGY